MSYIWTGIVPEPLHKTAPDSYTDRTAEGIGFSIGVLVQMLNIGTDTDIGATLVLIVYIY